MAALPSRIARVETASNDPRSRRVGGTALLARVAAALVALACAALGLAIAAAYPIAPRFVVGAFVAWSAFSAARVSFAFPSLLALMPVTGFAMLTGWLTFEELDLFVLATCAGGYAARAIRPMPKAERAERPYRPALSIFSLLLLGLFLASTAIALQRGLAAAGPWHFDWWQGYDDPQNSLRIFKPFAWAVLMSTLLLDELRRPAGFERLCLGMTAALGLGSLAVLQERYAFTGLFDFSSDYRVTAPFWEMHIGGAALDGFLALTIPFAAREAMRHTTRVRVAFAWVVLALAAYACFVTFSRGVYAAVPLSLLVLTVLVYRQRQRIGRRALWTVLGGGAVFAAVVAACAFFVFRGGGYRSVLAALLVLAFALPVESSLRRTRPVTWPRVWLSAAFAALLLGSACFAVSGVLPKGPYLVFALAFAVTLASTSRNESKPGTKATDLFAIAGWLWMAIAACLVARHWGGSGAFLDTATVLGVLVVLSFATAFMKNPVWPVARRERFAVIGFAAFVTAAVAVFTAGAYMGNRFHASEGDLDLRTSHWREGLDRLRGSDWLFGKGLGRFPATSQFESPGAAAPGAYRLVHRDGETFVALSTPRLRYIGFDEMFRFSQRVTVRPGTPYRVRVEARSNEQNSLHLELCEKQLLYHADCRAGDPQVMARSGPDAKQWQRIEFPIDTVGIGSSPWYAPRPVWFAIAAYNANSLLEIRRVEMLGPDGVDVIANGSFTNGTAHWFSSSDRWHLPYHIKNIVLDVLFDQGTVGLALFALLVGAATFRTAVGRAFRHPDAPVVAAALVGYLVVGAFDSLLDVPRVAFVFYLVVAMGLMLRNPRVAATATFAAPPPPVAAPVEDPAAARALRRQAAFGTRRSG